MERLARRLPQRRVLVDDPRLVERGLHFEHGLFGGFELGIQPPQHGHGQDHIAVFAPHIEVAQHIVGDAPDEVRDPVQVAVAHSLVSRSSRLLRPPVIAR